MLTIKRVGLMGAAAVFGMVSVLVTSPYAHAKTYDDTGAAVVVLPKIRVIAGSVDTLVQLYNQRGGSQPVAAHCFYVNANSRCNNTGAVCTSSSQCLEDEFYGSCQPGWIETNFDVILTPNQPLAWSASSGLTGGLPGESLDDGKLPCPGGLLNPCNGSNAGTRVPPVSEPVFIGELKCVQTDRITRRPAVCSADSCRNDLAGNATIYRVDTAGQIDVAKYNAIGLRTFGDNDGDGSLVIGGDAADAEYQPCAEVVVCNHLFDGAVDPISGVYTTESELTLVPCTQDFLIQSIPPVTAQFLVYNEFEQRFSTSRQVRCLLDSVISNIDTSQNTRSIFHAAVSGTVAGQMRIRGVNGGLIGSMLLDYEPTAGFPGGSAGYNCNQAVDRSESDLIRIP